MGGVPPKCPSGDKGGGQRAGVQRGCAKSSKNGGGRRGGLPGIQVREQCPPRRKTRWERTTNGNCPKTKISVLSARLKG